MNKLILAAIGAVAISAVPPAGAADLSPAYKAPGYQQPRCSQFGGFYIGGNVGWAQLSNEWTDRNDWVDSFDFDFAIGTAKTTKDGVAGGVQGGYNWQRGCTLFGIEADGNWADLKSSKLYTPTDIPDDTKLTIDTKVNWYSTLRGRTGIVYDDLLLYVTGGLAFASISQSWTMNDLGGSGQIESFSADKMRWGAAVGAGVEWAWTQNWSVRSEALWLRFKEQSTTVFSPAGALADKVANPTFDTNNSIFVARVGVNYRFGGPGY